MTSQLKLIGRCLNGVTVVAYYVQNLQTGEQYILNTELVKKLASQSMLINCTAQSGSNGDILLRGKNCHLRDLPKYDIYGNIVLAPEETNGKPLYQIVGRRMEGRTVLGYMIQRTGTSESLSASIQDVLDLIKEKRLTNARAQYSNGKIVIRAATGKSLYN